MQNKKLGLVLQSIAAVAATAVLTACGGSGGGGAPATPPTITSPGLFADVGVTYPNPSNPSEPVPTLTANGTGPFTWVVTSGTLPAGLSITPEGKLSGSTSSTASVPVTIEVTGPGGKDTKSIQVGGLARVHRVSQDAAGGGGDVGSGDGQFGAPPSPPLRSRDPGISGDGRFVVFDSISTGLVPGVSTNGKRQIYLKDRWTGLVELVSVNTAGTAGDDDSHVSVVSDDGRLVAFDSFAKNLVGNDGNNSRDVFLRDRVAKTTVRISQNASSLSDGICPNGQGEPCNSFDPSISADGSLITFGSLATLNTEDIHISPGPAINQLEADIYVFNRTSGGLQLVTRGIGGVAANGLSGSPAISADGSTIAFASTAGNLASGDPEPGAGFDDIFVYNVATRVITKVSNVTATGQTVPNGVSQNPTISRDGSRVVFSSLATNLVNADTNNAKDIFVTNRQANGSYAYPAVGARLGAGTGVDSDSPSIDRDGAFVAFQSEGTGLPGSPPGLNGQQQIFAWQIGQSPVLASANSGGFAGNGESRFPTISGNGRFIAFFSAATDLVSGDGGNFDAFVAQRP